MQEKILKKMKIFLRERENGAKNEKKRAGTDRTEITDKTDKTGLENGNHENGTRNRENGTRKLENGPRKQGNGTRNQENGSRNRENGTQNQENGPPKKTRTGPEHGERDPKSDKLELLKREDLMGGDGSVLVAAYHIMRKTRMPILVLDRSRCLKRGLGSSMTLPPDMDASSR